MIFEWLKVLKYDLYSARLQFRQYLPADQYESCVQLFQYRRWPFKSRSTRVLFSAERKPATANNQQVSSSSKLIKRINAPIYSLDQL